MNYNKLKLNEDKTAFIVFGTLNQLKHLNFDSLQLGHNNILRTAMEKDLELMDSQLKNHVAKLIKT